MRTYTHSYQLVAKHRKIMNERRQDENYKSGDDTIKDYFNTVGQFYRHSEGDAMSKYEAQNKFEKGERVFFSINNPFEAFNRLEIQSKGYCKETRRYNAISESNKPISIEVGYMKNNFISIQIAA